ncbi:MAG: fructose bisphosphate aldolase [Candidatus Saccharibacteria bacterium]|nr:fructose bisphosphate aldolase [Candidatus Saccharibacteria bacterium]
MNTDMLQQMKTGRGFIAALDQSGGSTPKALAAYGIDESQYGNNDQMFELVHQMRSRIITSPAFNSNKIIGVILFERTMLSQINGKPTADYLWQDKHIVPFLKIDVGLDELANGVQLMKEVPNFNARLEYARQHGIFGTKMRSVIHEANEQGIRDIVVQQFQVAKVICKAGLVPIIEPEVDITAVDKAECEQLMKSEIIRQLESWNPNHQIMFKFSIPSIANFYSDLYSFSAVVRIVALSGGYSVDEACQKLTENHNMPASFSRALLQNLRAQQSDDEFNNTLAAAIEQIYQASIN